MSSTGRSGAHSATPPSLEECWGTAARSIDARLRALLGEAADVEPALAHVLAVPGKRIRSLVTLAAASLDPDCDSPAPAAFDAAAAVEAIHEGTLVHDDILDASDTRRGQPSVAARFGARAAVFAGAYLASTGLASIAAQCERDGLELDPELLCELAQAEILEFLPPCADAQLRQRRLNRVSDGKTGALFRLAMRLGAAVALAAGARGPAPGGLDPIASALGRGFQIRDDILDMRCDASLRRHGASDLARGQVNWPLHFWVEASPDPAAALRRIGECVGNARATAGLMREVLDSRALSRACAALEAELDSAYGHAAALPRSPGRSVLLRLADGLRLS